GISTTGVMPLARVPWNDPAYLMKILDAGAYGVICPMINTRAQAEALVAACKYPPRGYRSFGPVRASIYAGSDYVDHANDDIVIMPMIETAEALKNLDAILSTPGVDAVYVGPSDLSLALGCKPRLDQTDAPVVEAQQQIVEACTRHGIIAGIHNATAAYSLKMIAAGYRFVTLASDSRHLALKAAEAVGAVRKRAGFLITRVGFWGGADPVLKANPDEVASVHRVPLEDLEHPDVPRLVTIPESDRPVIQVPLLSTLVHAPTAAVVYQLREVVMHGRPTRVDHFEQPVWAWG